MILAVSSSLLAADKSDNSPTHANVAYGPHKPNVLDIWIAKGDGPRPLHVYIHGGGWIGGDKLSKGDPQKHWLAKGISYAAINYRHTPQASLPAPVHDAARAIRRCAWTLAGHTGSLYSVCAVSAGVVASASDDKTVWLWSR